MQVMLVRLMSKGEYLIVPKETKFSGPGKLGLSVYKDSPKSDKNATKKKQLIVLSFKGNIYQSDCSHLTAAIILLCLHSKTEVFHGFAHSLVTKIVCAYK